MIEILVVGKQYSTSLVMVLKEVRGHIGVVSEWAPTNVKCFLVMGLNL